MNKFGNETGEFRYWIPAFAGMTVEETGIGMTVEEAGITGVIQSICDSPVSVDGDLFGAGPGANDYSPLQVGNPDGGGGAEGTGLPRFARNDKGKGLAMTRGRGSR